MYILLRRFKVMRGGEIWKNIVKSRDEFVINLTNVYGSPRPGADHKKN
jgi:hypothetical protein